MEQRFTMIVANLQSVFALFIIVHFWKAIFINNGGETIRGYTYTEIVTYYFLMRIMYNRVSTFGASRFAKQIKSGEITKILVKPVDLVGHFITDYVTGANLWSLGNLVTVLTMSSIFLHNVLVMPSNTIYGVLFLCVFMLNGFLTAVINLLLGLAGFWTTEVTHLKLITTQIIAILSGGLIPLTFFPLWAQRVLSMLPFKYLIQFPIDIYFGKIPPQEIGVNLVILTLWTLAFYFLTKLIYRKGARIYESYN